MFIPKTINAATTKNTAIAGTNFSLTDAILFTPPKITKATITVTTKPVTQVGIFMVDYKTPEIALDCVAFPVPIHATIANTANEIASHLHFNPFLI